MWVKKKLGLTQLAQTDKMEKLTTMQDYEPDVKAGVALSDESGCYNSSFFLLPSSFFLLPSSSD